MNVVTIRDITTDALGYWERRRPLFAQFSGCADQWRQDRWVLLVVGCALGAIVTRAIVTSPLHL